MVRWLEPLLGTSLMAIVLADVFLTVLYARAGTGIMSDRLARLVWLATRAVASSQNKQLLSFCGPAIVVALLLTWSLLLALGAALIVHPMLGTSITNSNQDTPTDFVTALYVAGSSLSIVGGSNFGPQSAGAKLLFLLNSVIGTSVISLTITYLMQIYGALRSRNSLCLKIHALSGETSDAAELLAHLFANNQLSAGYNNLSELAAELTDAKEAHHFYPILFYFRFPEPIYAVSRSWLVALDAVSLIRSALPKDAEWLKQSGAVTQIWSSATLLLSTLNKVFMGDKALADSNDADRHLWKLRFDHARERLQRAGISVTETVPQSQETYIGCRRRWDALVHRLGAAMAYQPAEIDTAIKRP
ncbi:two pore domain potassium channel family protein [Bradyrhizobium sp. BR 10289]|uniref:two pore domain potassium channel family protein n=1 Tax=Bradyrhizobium sp. BR 10289 TaxID=2749993 RepID=UPI001C651B02|nr:two pore domain potassium channel family protein [Bradyrhizobium sp. BR 10289]MBW7970668.1 two pore domain potassium channel family protein [Bradyrhizobium sp. BR 10289]